MKDLAQAKEQLQQRLSPQRYAHSLAVMEQAVFLAKAWGGNQEKAACAGLLHDICKEVPDEEQLQYLAQHGILMNNYWVNNPGVWHGLTGAIYLRETLGISDIEILDAVCYHVLGRPHMTLLDYIVFVADYTSADRDYGHSVYMRSKLPGKKEEIAFEIIQFTLKKIAATGSILLPEAVESYNYLSLLLHHKSTQE